MSFLSPSLKCDLLERMNGAIDLSVLLDLLGEEIENLNAFNGYMIYLRDAKSENLICHKVHYNAEFHSLECTFYHHKAALGDHAQNPNAKAYQQRAIIRVNSDNANEVEKQMLSIWKVEEFTAIPIRDKAATVDQPPIGTFLFLNQARGIDDDTIEMINELVALFYQPIHNALEYAFLKEQRRRFEEAEAENARFLKFIIEMNNLTSPEKIYEMFAKELFSQLAFDGIAFFLAENNVLANTSVAINDPRYQDIQNTLTQQFRDTPYQLKTTEGGVAHTFLADMNLMFPDAQKIMHLPMTEKDRLTVTNFKTLRTFLMTPIRYQNKPIGAIMFFSLADVVPIADTDLHLLANLSSFLGTAITNSKNYALSQEQNREIARLNLILEDKVKELAEQASTDRLTGLHNFRIFEQELARRISEYQRGTDKGGLSIAVIDIDHFKKFNDTYGHSAGNDVLAGVAHEISKLARKMDLACRYGGEEFVIIMSKCDLEGAKTFAERMRMAIEHASFNTEAGTLSVTVSIGCAAFVLNDTNETLFSRADKALYRAKHNGRNRIEA